MLTVPGTHPPVGVRRAQYMPRLLAIVELLDHIKCGIAEVWERWRRESGPPAEGVGSGGGACPHYLMRLLRTRTWPICVPCLVRFFFS